ncbi:hypothetical protein J7T55_006459 [Diaporthe amygdali]|uniref:uncharacterized protein n=1 Tax=Phomopsis amygdali TaxID=1214568 RepID=UPI0022FF2D2A|nr:uncharacterized protein J7T55_006459 [Diaporthe amygdali]KAJ0125115.1 hypothetical protein J7T55_006459 [Diaporthe amygdali]
MSSLVSDFIINNPVTRTVVRRFSSPFAAGPSPESRRPFSRDDYPEENGDAIAECDGPSSPFPSLGRFTRTPDIALGARSPPLLIPQRRVATAPVPEGLSRPLTVPSIAPLRLEMELHGLSDTESTAEPQAALDGGAQAAERESRRLPADDGMGAMRLRILSIQSSNITFDQKRYLTQQLLTENYTSRRLAKAAAEGKSAAPVPSTEGASASTSRDFGFGVSALETIKAWTGLDERARLHVSEGDRRPTYVPATAILNDEEDLEDDGGRAEDADGAETQVLGCVHYRRNVKLQCAACEKWYTCRLCHDEAEEHILPRKMTKHMLCMLCGHAQKASDTCVNCGECAAQYYCNICKLWSDDVNKPIYHCDDCGICRVGHGLDKDFFHCKTCRACISITQTNNHKCIERATDADCPICGENMFASHKTVIFMDCGHSIHRTCFNEYMASSYKCPICSKSIVNMEALFTNLANIIREQPMPEEFENVTSIILCNDCSAKCTTQYHFLGLRCQICRSYNTVELERSEMPGDRTENDSTPAHGHGHPAPETRAISAHPHSPSQNRAFGSNPGSILHPSGSHAPYSSSQDAASPAGHHAHAVPQIDSAMDDDDVEELNFWGGETRSGPESEEEDDDYEDDTDAEDSENDEDDDNEDDDIMLFGHR